MLVKARHASRYAQRLYEIELSYRHGGNDALQAIQAYDLEAGQIYHSRVWCVENMQHHADIAVLCCNFATRGQEITALKLLPSERLRWFKDARRALRYLPPQRSSATVLLGMAITYSQMGQYETYLELTQRALRLATEYEDSENIRSAHQNINNALFALGRHDEAGRYLDAHHVQRRVSGIDELWVMIDEGRLYHTQNSGEAAIDQFLKAQKLATELGLSDPLFVILLCISQTCSQILTDYVSALPYAKQAYDIAKVIGSKSRMVQALHEIGVCQLFLGDYADAIQSLGQALILADAIEDARDVANIHIALGNAHMSYDGNIRIALASFETARNLYQQVNYEEGTALADRLIEQLNNPLKRLGGLMKRAQFWNRTNRF